MMNTDISKSKNNNILYFLNLDRIKYRKKFSGINKIIQRKTLSKLYGSTIYGTDESELIL